MKYILIIMAVVILLMLVVEKRLSTKCVDEFGQGWSGRMMAGSHDICVDSEGNVKYP